MKECQNDIVQICRRARKIQGIVEIHWGVGLLDREVVQYKNARTGERLAHWNGDPDAQYVGVAPP